MSRNKREGKYIGYYNGFHYRTKYVKESPGKWNAYLEFLGRTVTRLKIMG